MLRAVFLALVLGVFAPALARAQAAHAPHVQISLISDAAAIAPGEHFKVALVQHIEQGWHTYWRNPGDSGDATKINWHLPAGFAAGDIQWPVPERMPVSFLMNYGYAGEAVFPVSMSAPAHMPADATVTLVADVSWLVCADICVPEHGTATLTLPLEAQGRANNADAARIAAVQLPQPAQGDAHITAGALGTLSFALDAGEAARNFYFFPYDRRAIDHAAPQNARLGAAGVSFSLKPGAAKDLGRAPLNGVVTFEQRDANGAWVRQAYEVHATPGAVIEGAADMPAPGAVIAADSAAAPVAPQADMSVWAAIALAFLGGLILNIMPCVLPVLSIKALTFVGGDPVKVRRQGVLYLIGVVVSFVVLAALLLALRSMGDAVGWGFQLQTPWVSAGLALLFFVIGLNLLGVFEIGGGVQNTGESLTRAGGDFGALFTGVLAVVAATPCTAPFMAGAIGMALMQPLLVALMIFLALALGFALPLTALSFLPALRRWLPKPGAWMERAKVVLAFPMFATAAWLVSVLSAQTGAGGVIGVLMFAAAIAFALVVARWGRAWIVVGAAALVVAGAFAIPALTARAAASAVQAAEAWTPARVAQLRAQGKPVFVNFTAAWCVTCQVNELGVLRSARVMEGFRDRGVIYLEADWTNPNPDIAAALAAQGRAGVPLYLYYPPGNAAPVVLPQVLSEQTVLNAISVAR
ncbi:MAG: protein-disulfide reductase DsbD family protein [Terricaulis sp.]